jgi:exopolysaccharide production protein ExoZ
MPSRAVPEAVDASNETRLPLGNWRHGKLDPASIATNDPLAKPQRNSGIVMIQSLQAIRGWAALLVVWYHCHGLFLKRSNELGYTESFWRTPDPPIAKFGAIGVDLFFILSGFIIFYTTWHVKMTWREFAIRRWIRIYPLWWVALAITCTFALIPSSTESFTWRELVYSIALIPYHNEAGELKPVVEVGWTLNYEIFFYLIFSFFLAMAPMKRLLGVTAVFTLAILIGCSFDFDTALPSVAFSPKTLEFVSGGWLAYCYIRGMRPPAWMLGLLALCLGILFTSFMTSEYWRSFGQGLFGVRYWMALIILFMALFCRPFSNHQFGKTSLLLGDASYSIYLFHSLALAVASGLWKRDILLPPTWISPWLLWCGLVLVLGIYGVMIHLFIERPLLAWFKQRFTCGQARKQKSSLVVLTEQKQPSI